ncbi:MAG: toxin HicA [Actinomycetota bacterium]
MGRDNRILSRMRLAPHDVPFDDVVNVCISYFGEPRSSGTSHVVFKTPWAGDPRVNIQRGNNGRAKTYQVRQVLEAIDKVTTGGGKNG